MQSGDFPAAIAKLEPVRKDPAAPPQVVSLLGTLYLRTGRAQEALDVLAPLAEAADADPAVLYNAGQAALALGQVGRGETYLMRSVQKNPGSPAGRDLGILLSRQGRVVEAYSLLRPWSLNNPTDADVRMLAGSLAVSLERPAEAEQLLSGLQEVPAVLLLKGRARAQQGDGGAAVALIAPIMLDHPPDMDLEVRRGMAEAYLAANRPADAVEVLSGKAGGLPALVLLLGRAQRRAGDTAGALATLAPLAGRLPAEPDTVGDPRPAVGIAVEYGALLVAAGRAAEAVPILEKATRLHEGSRDAWTGLSQALEAAGRKDEAQQARTRAETLARPAPQP
jgi:Flp pilus assembly protein TadD